MNNAMRRRRHRYDPNRIRPRKAEDRLHRIRKGGVLKMLARCIREDRKGSKS